MLKQTAGLSSGEILLIKIALDIWSGSGHAYVWEIIEVLDKDNFFYVPEALIIVRRNRGV